MKLNLDQRRRIICEANIPKKGHFWFIVQCDADPGYLLQEVKIQFASLDGTLIAYRLDRDRYPIVDRATSERVTEMPGRSNAKALIDELGPMWDELRKKIYRKDDESEQICRKIIAKHKVKL